MPVHAGFPSLFMIGYDFLSSSGVAMLLSPFWLAQM